MPIHNESTIAVYKEQEPAKRRLLCGGISHGIKLTVTRKLCVLLTVLKHP